MSATRAPCIICVPSDRAIDFRNFTSGTLDTQACTPKTRSRMPPNKREGPWCKMFESCQSDGPALNSVYEALSNHDAICNGLVPWVYLISDRKSTRLHS